MLRFAEEIMLLLLDEANGDFSARDSQAVRLALAGGVLMDLALESRIDTDVQNLVVLDAQPTGDPLLDAVLAEIAVAERTRDARYWVERVQGRADEIRDAAIARLIERGVLLRRSGRFLRALRTRARPVVDGAVNREVKQRIVDLVFGDDIPDPRDVVLICLCDVCGLFASLLTRDELDRAYPRIEQIGRLDLIGQAVMTLVADAQRESEERLQFLIQQGLAAHRA